MKTSPGAQQSGGDHSVANGSDLVNKTIIFPVLTQMRTWEKAVRRDGKAGHAALL
jgi:hypothetical protein